MKKLKILNINKYEYKLIDDRDNIYQLNIEFYNVNKKPQINDFIYVSNGLINEFKINKIYSFGEIKKISSDKNDYIALKSKEDLIYLERYYG